MELAEGGDLFDKIESDIGIGEDIAHLYFTQLISAVIYMHQKGIGHRDIKPENLLLSAEGNLKIADFGLATLFEYNGQKKLCTSSCGSPPYTAPEVVTCDHRVKKRLNEGYYGNLVDIWSCAVVLFVLLVGNTPWDEPLDRSYEFNLYTQSSGRPDDELWHKLPDNVIGLLRGMMCLEPNARMPLDAVQRHPWVQRTNPYINSLGSLQHPMQVATEMFESMKIDFSSDPKASQRSQPSNDGGMEIDSHNIDAVLTNQVGQSPANGIMFDWEGRETPSNTNRTTISNQWRLDDHLAEEPSCSQFSSTPRVPLTRTQFAKRFLDVLPSHSLTRFFSFWPSSNILSQLTSALEKLEVSFKDSSQLMEESVEHVSPSFKVRLLDSRNCPLSGNIVLEALPGVEGNAYEVHFTKAKGDPLEWRRFFKSVVVLAQEVVFRPDENAPLPSQTDPM